MIKIFFVSLLCLLTLVNCGGGNPTVDLDLPAQALSDLAVSKRRH